jgi:hypothetical protein
MAEIKDVKVWKNSNKTETRIYVHTIDGREGCKYITGNPWHAAKSIDGNLTDEEWTAAKALAVWDKCWHPVYQNDNPRPARCPDCGGYDCGPNCNSNNLSAPANNLRSQYRETEHAMWETEETLAGLGL